MGTIIKQCPSLWGYLSQHLKVMATIANEKGVIQWAVFFGKEYESAPKFNGKVNGSVTELKWSGPRPLWLIPISCEAKDEAESTLKEENRVVPRICGHKIVIRNPEKVNGPSKKEEYLFWYDDHEQWERDPTLVLSKDAYLEELSKNGEWKILQKMADDQPEQSEYEEEWPVWITTSEIETNEKIIVFPAPACHIVNENGAYLDHQIWFGVRYINNKRIVNWPFININDAKTNDPKNKDCPLVWRDTKRIDDLLKLTQDDNEQLTADHYDKRPFDYYFKDWGDGDHQLRVTDIINAFDNSSQSKIVQSWMIWEKAGEEPCIHPFYIGHYELYLNCLTVSKQIKTTQISRTGTSHIFVHSAKANIKSLWEKAVDKIGLGVKSVLASSGFSLTPKIESTRVLTVAEFCSGEWKTPNSVSLFDCDTFPQYDLAAIRIFSEDNDVVDTIDKVSITLPNISSISNEAITLQNATCDFGTSLNKVNDDGTLIYFVLESFKIQSESNKQITFGSFNFHIPPEASHLDTKSKYGIFSLKLKHQDTRRPFFLWQWHKGMKDDIFISYAIEDFSLPVSKIEAAGQDLLPNDKLLSPAGLGTSIEGFGERADPPLVIPLPEESEDLSNDPKYLLTFSESVNIGQDYKIDVKLQEVDPEANKDKSTEIKAVVIDTNPQLTALVHGRFLQQPGYDDGAWVLARHSPLSNSKGGWELLDDKANSEGFYIVLPAQGIGEAYVKGRDENPLPVPEGEPREGEAIDYRFGAPAILRLSPGRLEQRYVMPPWNLRHIWGTSGDIVPGVPFHEAQFELLYGLMAHLKPEKTFIAELASKLGEIPVPPTNSIAWPATKAQNKQFSETWREYLRFYRAWKSRLAILEPSKEDSFKNAEFDKGISFRPRVDFRSNIDKARDQLDKIVGQLDSLSIESGKERLKMLISTLKENIDDDCFLSHKESLLESLKESELTEQYNLVKEIFPLKRVGASLKYPILKEKLNEIFKVSTDELSDKFSGSITAEMAKYFTNLQDCLNAENLNYADIEKIYNCITHKLREINEGGNGKEEWIKKIVQSYPLVQRILLDKTEVSPTDFLNGEDLLNPVKKMIAAHDPKGLAGGFHYSFESEAIYKEFWRDAFDKGSSSGEVKELAFSSLGGWGRQTARFAADKTVIKSNTTMGRTHFYSVERIGRIGVFWNKAKHVIEYERTVVPSEQFKGDQPPHLGRPLVRKVREYVEILEPIRKYPDFAADPKDAPGSVISCAFKSIIIPVKSAWGRDVISGSERIEVTDESGNKKTIEVGKSIGWEVPIWKPGADPRVYPKPQIILSVLASPEADEKEILHNLSEPQNLYFYTDTRVEAEDDNGVKIQITSDVHAWPSVQEVDFTNLPEPEQYNIDPAAGDSPELIGLPMPDVLDVFPGFERFTFRVDRNEIPSSVVGRYYPAAALTGRLRTVSMSRGEFNKKNNWWTKDHEGPPLDIWKAALKKLIQGEGCLLRASANAFKDINTQIQHGYIPSIDEFKGKINALVKVNNNDTIQKSLGVAPPALKYLYGLWDEKKAATLTYPVQCLWRESLENAEGFINRSMSVYDEQVRSFFDDLKLLTAKLSESGQRINDQVYERLESFEKRIVEAQGCLEFSLDLLAEFLTSSSDSVLNEINSHIEEWRRFLETIDLSVDSDQLKKRIEAFNQFQIPEKRISHFIEFLKRSKEEKAEIKGLNALKENLNKLESEINHELAKDYEVSTRIRNIKEKFNERAADIYLNRLEIQEDLKNKTFNILSDWTGRFTGLRDEAKKITTCYTAKIGQKVKSIKERWDQGANIDFDLNNLRSSPVFDIETQSDCIYLICC